MNTKRFSKSTLSLALAALAGGLATNNTAQAVELANTDRLGDAAIFQYYTAKGDWQTFIRLVNTSEDAIVVKVRFREAANSREVLDFEVAMSPHDMWSGWTTRDAIGTTPPVPGIRTQDTSCLFPIPGESGAGEGFDILDASTNLVGAVFKDRAFTGIYDDGANLDSLVRMSEGHVEVIGIAKYDCDGSDQESQFCEAVTHKDNGKPNNCGLAESRFFGFGGGTSIDNAGGDDMDNVLAARAYLVNVPNGQGAAYDPDMLADCADRPLELEAIRTDTNPDLDSCDARVWGSGDDEDGNGVGPIAKNQRLSDGSLPPVVQGENLRADVAPFTPRFPATGIVLVPAKFGDGDYNDTFAYDLSGDGDCGDPDETGILENDVPAQVYKAAQEGLLAPPVNGCITEADTGGLAAATSTVLNGEFSFEPWRIKQKGLFNDNAVYEGYGTPVTGGVDGVSDELMRTAVINEWAASYNPDSIITDYFTQWVLTFPTKHYYVDLQDDEKTSDDISPTLVELSTVDPSYGTYAGLAFAPFEEAFKGGVNPGMSCEPFYIDMWNREERYRRFTSPAPSDNPELCYETNVVVFNERYETRGLASSFSTTIQDVNLPTEIDGKTSERGWARLTFNGKASTNLGLSNPWFTKYGLPVTGFMLSIYNTGAAANNYTSANAHSYLRDEGRCTLDEGNDGDPLCRKNQDL